MINYNVRPKLGSGSTIGAGIGSAVLGTIGGLAGTTLFPGLGTAAGIAAGVSLGGMVGSALGGVAGTISDDYNTKIEKKRLADQQTQQINKPNYSVNSVGLNPMYSYGQAADGLTAKGQLPVEVEGGELRLRKIAGKYQVLQGYQGPSHEAGGIDTNLRDGDIVIPKDKAGEVMQYLKAGRHDLVDQFVRQLPEIGSKADGGGIAGMVGSDYAINIMNQNSGTTSTFIPNNIPDYNMGFNPWKTESTTPTVNNYSKNVLEDNPNTFSINDNSVPRGVQQINTGTQSIRHSQPGDTGKGWWDDMSTTDKIVGMASVAGMGYATYGLLNSYLRKPSYPTMPQIQRPSLISPEKIENNVEPMIQAGKDTIQREGAASRSQMTGSGVNPLYAGSAINAGTSHAMVSLYGQAAQMKDQISQAQAQLNMAVKSNNANAINQWKDRMATLQFQYDDMISKLKMQTQAENAQERQGLYSMILNIPMKYAQYQLQSNNDNANISGNLFKTR